jgi:spore coat protein U-like protein
MFWAVGQAAAWGAVTCTVSTSGVAFGTYNAIGNQNADTIGTIAVTCNGNVGDQANYQIALSTGSGSYTARLMPGPSDNMQYNLYKDAARSVVWGDGTGGTSVVTDSYILDSTSVVKYYSVYGRVPAAQNQLNAGSYSDTVVVTLTY